MPNGSDWWYNYYSTSTSTFTWNNYWTVTVESVEYDLEDETVEETPKGFFKE